MAIGGIRVYTSNNNGMNRIRILGGLRVISPALRTVFSEGGRGLELARAFFGDFQDTVIDMFADYQAIWKPAASEGASIIGLQWEVSFPEQLKALQVLISSRLRTILRTSLTILEATFLITITCRYHHGP